MHSLAQFIEAARDPNFTQAQAAEMVRENVVDMVAFCGYTLDEAHKIVLQNIGYFAVYYEETLANRVFYVYQTQHPTSRPRNSRNIDSDPQLPRSEGESKSRSRRQSRRPYNPNQA